jgi:hypothetical protein
MWPTENPPQGWLMLNGAGFDKNRFPRLASIYPSGQLADWRGVFPRGKDSGRGIDPNRVLGDLQWSQNASHTHGYTVFDSVASIDHWNFSIDNKRLGISPAQTDPQGGNESRPVNVSVNFIIRAA